MYYIYDTTTFKPIASPQKGYTTATPILFDIPVEVDIFPTLNIAGVDYYFGDGTREYTAAPRLSTEHTYVTPGNYSVSAVVYTVSDISTTPAVLAVDTVVIKNFVDEAVTFGYIPSPTIPGFYTEYPYKVYCTTTRLDTPPVIDLYAQFTRSLPPQEPRNKWSFVRPEWKFTDVDKNLINSVTPVYNEIKIDPDGNISDTGVVVGLSGAAEFYFVEDLPSADLYKSNQPTPFIWATLNTETVGTSKDSDIKNNQLYSYSTSKARAFAPHISYWVPPTHLSISENGAREFSNPRWVGAPLPFFVSVEISSTTIQIEKHKPESSFVKYVPYDFALTATPVLVQVNAVDATTLTPYMPVEFSISNTDIGVYSMKQYDSDGTSSAGFLTGSAVPYVEQDIRISAVATFDLDSLYVAGEQPSYSPYLWLPNPAAACVSMVYYTGTLNASVAAAIGSGIDTYSTYNVNIPTINNINLDATEGYTGIYTVAVSPGLQPDYTYYTWVADADSDYLYKINAKGDIVQYLSLSTLAGKSKVTPAGLCIDSEKNVWVALYDTRKIYKIDPYGTPLLNTEPPVSVFPVTDPGAPGIFDSTATGASKYVDVPLMEATCIDSDANNNVWVTYSNTLSSFLVKFDTNGNYLTHVNTGGTTPQDIIVKRDNTLWVAETSEFHSGVGKIVHYSSTGAVLDIVDNIEGLGYIAMDKDDDIWFTYDFNKVGKIDVSVSTSAYTNVINVSSFNPSISASPISSIDASIQFTALEGIGCNDNNLIFVVHSIDNRVYVYDAAGSLVDSIYIVPHLQRGIYNDSNRLKVDSDEWIKSIQVLGDWTGSRWAKKYSNRYTGTITLSGLSKPLNVRNLNPNEFRKRNQDFNMSEYLKNLVNMDFFKDNNSYLFDTVLPSIYGDSSKIDDSGTIFYEKIANFLDNTSDIDTCDIDMLHKLATMLSVEISNSNTVDMPYQMKQVMNLLSISQKKLWGMKCKCNMNFTSNSTCTGDNICKICGKCKLNNKGDVIDIYNYTVAVGVPFVVKEIGLDSYYLHYPVPIKVTGVGGSTSTLMVYNASMLSSVGFRSPIEDNYNFYTYISATNDNHIQNTIDWENPYTTVNYNLISSANSWQGQEEAIDTMLNYYLYKGLEII
jgi:sugar lactone lactonase YvrE